MIKILKNLDEAESIVKNGGLIIAKTDTLYGILGDALNPEVVERVYSIKKRNKKKPFIILIPDISYLKIFYAKTNPVVEKILNRKGITVILPIEENGEFEYLHRGTNELAFRIPKDKDLIEFMKKIKKPLIAPSANIEGQKPAKSIPEAISYFGNHIDAYIDGGTVKESQPSTIVKFKNNNIELIREGNIPFEKILRLANFTGS